MEFVMAIVAGFTLGFLHAFDVDHVAAVTALSSKKAKPSKVARLGATWGLGHTATLLILGAASIALKFSIPPSFEFYAELMVGIVLVVIGVWVLKDVFSKSAIHLHKHTHDGVEHIHLHSHKHREDHDHTHSLFMVGAAHGAAGTAAVLLLIPIAISQSVWVAVIYLLLFGVGTITAMALFAYGLGRITQRIQSKKTIAVFRATTGAMSLVIGILWISEKVL